MLLFLFLLLHINTRTAIVNLTDSNILRTPVQSSNGLTLSLVSISTNPGIQPVCINWASVNDLPLLAHKICQSSKFTTYTSYSLIKPSTVNMDSQSLHSSTIYCKQSLSYQTSCSITNSTSPCQFLLSIECGSCHSHIQLAPNASVLLKSPLYPVLQPGMICQYDLELGEEVAADISIDFDDFSLAPPLLTHSHVDTGHCVSSYLHVLAGNTFSQMDSLAMLCGENVPDKLHLRRQNVVRLQLVTGADVYARNHRGFSMKVQVSSAFDNTGLTGIAIIIAFVLGLFIVFGVLVAGIVVFQKWKAQKRKRRPRRGITWHGSAPRPGHSLHMERTEYITRQLGRVEEGVEPEVTENVYGSLEAGVPMYHYRNMAGITTARSLPVTPNPDSQIQESITPEPNDNKEVDKIYETFHSSASSIGSAIDLRSNSDPASHFYLTMPSLPNRPSWTLQPPATDTEQGASPLYLCLPAPREENSPTPGCDSNVTVKLSEASLEAASRLSKGGQDYGSISDVYASAAVRESAELPSVSSPVSAKTPMRQSLLSLSDTTKKVTKLLGRMSLSEQSSRLLRKFSQSREGNIGEECLIGDEREEDDCGEKDDVFY